ncbi:MAG: hypothetical protein PHQ52_07395, partial [Candidatus Omnitrophica bacterium]|nr:hypothetical protein [Candidatus Omnitrophota bacterium]
YEQQQEELVKKLKQLKSDPKLMDEIDLDQDGKVSLEEWDIARKKIEMEVLNSSIKKVSEDHADILIGKPKQHGLFILSDKSEKELINKFSIVSKLCIIGGPIICCLGVLYLLCYFKINI